MKRISAIAIDDRDGGYDHVLPPEEGVGAHPDGGGYLEHLCGAQGRASSRHEKKEETKRRASTAPAPRLSRNRFPTWLVDLRFGDFAVPI